MINSSGSGNITVAASSAVAAASSSSPPSATSREYNNKPTNSNIDCGISIDTTNFVVDIPQQDSGSNQSGSDSGLGGYTTTNSISSDNSSFTTNNAIASATPITGQVVVGSVVRGKTNNNNNSGSCSNTSNSSNKNKNSNNSNESSNNHDDSSIGNNKYSSSGLASSGTKIAPPNQQQQHQHHKDASAEFVDLAYDSNSKIGSLDKQPTIFKSKDNLVGNTELLQKPPPAPPKAHPITTTDSSHLSHQSVNVPVLKSLLKKPTSHLTSDNGPNKQKHNRNVSFNQTVIVFCEEFGVPSPDGDQYEPPLGYQDALGATLEPPDDYCDHKVDERKKSVVLDTDKPKTSISGTANTTNGRDNSDGFDHRGAFCSDAVSNLTADQLIGLLENDTLLETFRLNCDDLSEDDFPINHVNSSHSYLCNDAISDYDSDSESSFYQDRKEAPNQILSPIDDAQNNIIISGNSSNYQKNKQNSSASGNTEPVDSVDRSHNDRVFSNESQPSAKYNPQRSMPARMKVSTVVDSSHSKRHQPIRQDDNNDPKFKQDPLCQTSSQKVYEHQQQQQQQQQQSTSQRLAQSEVVNTSRSAPMLIKQTNLEPVALSKSIIVTNQELTQTSNKNLTHKSKFVTQNSFAHKSSDQIKDNQILEFVPGQLGISNQTTRNTGSQAPAVGVDLNTQGCHICKVIESNKPKVATEIKNAHIKEDSLKIQVNNTQTGEDSTNLNARIQSTNRITTTTNQPAVFNQSCISCREATLQQHQQQQQQQQQNLMRNGFQPVAARQPTRPTAAYQLVYVVDSKGNRVRALSLIGASGVPGNPNPSNAGSSLADRRIFIAQNGVRFPNPVSVSGQIVNFQQNQHPHQLNSNSAGLQQYRVLGSIQAQNQPQTQPHQFNQNLNPNNNMRPPPTYVPTLQRVVPMGRPRPHTVYYVRQPLDTQNICQSFETSGSNSRSSFPDPHEIRRLDGLRGPTAAINLSNQKINPGNQAKIPDLSPVEDVYHRQSGDTCKQVSNSMRDEVDDPTFGFSKRPSVKVVAPSSSNLSDFNFTSNNLRSRVDGRSQGVSVNAHQNNIGAVNRLPGQAEENVRPVSLVVMRSQTLDRGHVTKQSQQQQQHQQSMKENMPSTSSMSNIHGSYTTNLPTPQQPNKVSINSTTQQPRISGLQSTNPAQQDNLRASKAMEARSSNLNDIRTENNKNVISINRIVPLAVDGKNVPSLDRSNRKTQGQPDVVYSMNI